MSAHSAALSSIFLSRPRQQGAVCRLIRLSYLWRGGESVYGRVGVGVMWNLEGFRIQIFAPANAQIMSLIIILIVI